MDSRSEVLHRFWNGVLVTHLEIDSHVSEFLIGGVTVFRAFSVGGFLRCKISQEDVPKVECFVHVIGKGTTPKIRSLRVNSEPYLSELAPAPLLDVRGDAVVWAPYGKPVLVLTKRGFLQNGADPEPLDYIPITRIDRVRGIQVEL